MATIDEGVIELGSGAARCAAAPRLGGTIAGFWWERRGRRIDWLRPASPAGLAAGDPRQMACFPLVPYSNRIRDGRFRFGGRWVQETALPPDAPHAIHGHGWRRSWTVVERAADALLIQYEHCPAPEASDEVPGAWPWAYRARQRIALEGENLAITTEIENLSAEPMPAGLGQHPYYPASPGATVTARARSVWLADAQTMPTEEVAIPDAWPLDRGLCLADQALDNEFAGWAGSAVITWPERGARLALRADQPLFSFLVIYSPAGRDFFCVEPVSHLTDAFNLAPAGLAATGLRVLAPGAILAGRMELRPTLE